MVPAKSVSVKLGIAVALAAALPALLLGGCDGKPLAPTDGEPPVADDPVYLTPPKPDAVQAVGEGWRLSGAAPPQAQVRLATPQGKALTATADARGRWTIVLGASKQPRIFGLSATAKGRQLQSEGYVLLTPTGQAAVLRAGAGARRIDAARRPGLRAIDFDRGGGLEISAEAAPDASLVVRLDERQVANGRADTAGRYEVSLPQAGSQTRILAGGHQAQVFGDGVSDSVSFQITPAAPLVDGPLRSQLTSAGLRVDWMTPGGGVQSTILVH